MTNFHKVFKDLGKVAPLQVNGFYIPIQLFGPRGTGKSTIAQQYAEKLNLSYSYLAGNGQTSKGDLLGYMDATGRVVESTFMKSYRDGGVFVLEEMDAMPQDVLIALNTAIDGFVGAFAGGSIKKHKDFRLISTSNTYTGGSEDYTARRRLDQSTLERFILIHVGVDPELEKSLFGNDYPLINFIREKLLPKSEYFSTRSAVFLIAQKALGFKIASQRTCFRNIPDWWDYAHNTSKLEDFFKYNGIKIISQDEFKKINKEKKTLEFQG